MKECKCGCGQEVTKEGNRFIKGHNKGMLNKKCSKETKKKMSEAAKNRKRCKLTEEHKRKLRGPRLNMRRLRPENSGENHPRWNGGSYDYWHSKAWKRFGKMYCEICNMNINEHFEKHNQRFDMHNTLEPKDYTVMESHVWMCLCKSCHKKID